MSSGASKANKTSIVLVGALAAVIAMLVALWIIGGRSEVPAGSLGRAATAADEARDSSTADAARPEGDAAHDDGAHADASRVAPTTETSRGAIASGPIRGRIVDVRTREPVPFLDVRLIAGAVEDAVATGL